MPWGFSSSLLSVTSWMEVGGDPPNAAGGGLVPPPRPSVRCPAGVVVTAWQLLGLGFLGGVVATVVVGLFLSVLHELHGGPNP